MSPDYQQAELVLDGHLRGDGFIDNSFRIPTLHFNRSPHFYSF